MGNDTVTEDQENIKVYKRFERHGCRTPVDLRDVAKTTVFTSDFRDRGFLYFWNVRKRQGLQAIFMAS